ncbi:MAG: pyroglutamyl-peptidase I [Clostridiales bacterium]|nr:pyroglutamyl-peptidase I [Candidatus Coliplasma caballi]
MKLLVTGFEAFGGETINPSWEAVKRLPAKIGETEIEKLELPVVYGEAARIASEKAKEIGADAILCVGQAGGRDAITPEVIGINLQDCAIPDNAGTLRTRERIAQDGADGYFSTLPVFAMVDAIKKESVPAKVSYSAGTLVCNDLLYSLLRRFSGTNVKVCFVHLPFLPEQAGDKFPSLTLDQDVIVLTAAIGIL